MDIYVFTSRLYALFVSVGWVSMIVILYEFTNVIKAVTYTFNQQSIDKLAQYCIYSLCLVGFVENVIPIYITSLRNTFVRQIRHAEH